MPGSIDRLPSGKWRVRVPAEPHPVTGARQYRTETLPAEWSRRDAQLHAAALINRGIGRKPDAYTVGDIIDQWLTLPRLTPATRRSATSTLRHVPVALRRKRADRVRTRDIDALYETLADVGTPTVAALHRYLHAAFALALSREELASNPVTHATPPRARNRKQVSLTLDEIATLANKAELDGQQTALWMRLHLSTGARRGEILALRWSALDPDRATITITASIDAATNRARKTTKTGRERTVALDAGTVRLARQWQQVQRERAIANGATLARDPLLICDDPAGLEPWHPVRATRLFARLARAGGIDGFTLHDLRHAAASVLIAEGVPATVVAKRLGHDSTTTTLNFYAHVLDDQDKAAGDLLAVKYGFRN